MIKHFMAEHVTGHRLMVLAKAQYGKAHNQSHNKMIMACDIVYVKTDYIGEVFNKMSMRSKPVKIITHNSDHVALANASLPACVEKWYALNYGGTEHPIVECLPLGLENRASPEGYSGDATVIDEIMKKQFRKQHLAFMNFNVYTNTRERFPVVERFLRESWVYYEPFGLQFRECMEITSQSKFVFCPPGNGWDTHRVYESLYLGAIPIVLNCYMYREFSKSVPMVLVNSWNDVTPGFLESEYERLGNTVFSYDILKMSYWKKRIKQ